MIPEDFDWSLIGGNKIHIVATRDKTNCGRRVDRVRLVGDQPWQDGATCKACRKIEQPKYEKRVKLLKERLEKLLNSDTHIWEIIPRTVWGKTQGWGARTEKSNETGK